MVTTLGATVLLPEMHPCVRITEVPVGTTAHFVQGLNPDEANSYLEIYFQFGPCTDHRKIVLNEARGPRAVWG